MEQNEEKEKRDSDVDFTSTAQNRGKNPNPMCSYRLSVTEYSVVRLVRLVRAGVFFVPFLSPFRRRSVVLSVNYGSGRDPKDQTLLGEVPFCKSPVGQS